ncbi:terminase small subunit [Deinococcus radiophilus]|uniref:Terminase small subunit n=1 Tax=Deinococcus radiophilus TaxID=32062 RepID=A0A3S0IBU0_9DEIO|nr:terminase small subunit [Deinococcus radiophilus]
MTQKQELFCYEFLIDLNATQAAIRADYSERTARSQAQRLLTNADIQARLRTLMHERSQRTQITADAVLEELAAIAFSNLADYAEWGSEMGVNFVRLKPSAELTRKQTGALKSIKHVSKRGKTDEDTLEVTPHDKLSALDKLAKHLNLYGEHGESEGASGFEEMIDQLARLRTQRERGDD